MAVRTAYPAYARIHEARLLDGSFAPNGSSAVAAASNKGVGFSVARSGVGTFVLTLDDNYVDLISVVATLQLSTTADQSVQVKGVTNSTSSARPTVTLVVMDDEGAAVDVAAAAGNRINFHIAARASGTKPG